MRLSSLRNSLVTGTALGLGFFAQIAAAHTVSIGYESAGARGAVTFWYGTYHDPSEATYTEGGLHVTNGGSYDTTVSFTNLVSVKPAGLIDGTTNFYSNGTALGTTNAYGGSGNVATWQGATLTGLSAGTYTFTYVPISSPTQVWNPR